MAKRYASTWWIAISKNTKLRVGRLVKAHGLKGALKLELYTDSPDQRFRKGQQLELQVPEDSPWHGKTVTVSELRFYNQSPVVFFEGVESRTQAESLVKAILLLEKATDQLPDEPEAWYDHQVIGLQAFVGDQLVGKVIRIEHLPAQDLLVLENATGELLVPFVKQIVPEINLELNRLILTPPAGLLELNREGEQ